MYILEMSTINMYTFNLKKFKKDFFDIINELNYNGKNIIKNKPGIIINGIFLSNDLINNLCKYTQYYPDNNGFYVYDIPDIIYPILSHNTIFNNKQLFDEEWYIELNKYIDSLKPYQKYIIKRYTHNGDEIVNLFLREPDIFTSNSRMIELLQNMRKIKTPLYAIQLLKYYGKDTTEIDPYINDNNGFSLDTYKLIEDTENKYLIEKYGKGDMYTIPYYIQLELLQPLIEEYIKDLREIIKNAPPLRYPLQVFRGSRTDYINKPYEQHLLKGFLSTTLDTRLLKLDGGFGKNIYQLILQPGTRCIFLNKNVSDYSNEFEILVDTDAYAIPSERIQKRFLSNKMDGIVNMGYLFDDSPYDIFDTRVIEIISKDGGGAGGANGSVSGGRIKYFRSKNQLTRRNNRIKYKNMTRTKRINNTRRNINKNMNKNTKINSKPTKRVWTEPLVIIPTKNSEKMPSATYERLVKELREIVGKPV